MSGFEVLRSLRVSKVKTPILILSGLASVQDKVKGLGFGADDYMTKPFHKDELELVLVKWLGHVVVGAETKAFNLVLDAGEAGEDQDWRLHLRDPQAPQHLEAGHIGEVQVKGTSKNSDLREFMRV